MPRLEVRTSEGVTLELEIAGPGTRFLASLLDGLLLATVAAGLALVLRFAAEFDPLGLANFALGLLVVGSLVVYVAYHVFFHWRGEGRTPGKSALGVRVVSLDGGPASLGQLLLRGALSPVDLLLLVPLPLGLILIGVTHRRQRLGDLVAGTVVARDDRAAARLEPWEDQSYATLRDPGLSLGAGDAARFDREDLVFLRDLVTRRGLDARRQQVLVKKVADYYRERLGVRDALPARQVVRELYLFLRDVERG